MVTPSVAIFIFTFQSPAFSARKVSRRMLFAASENLKSSIAISN
jgi:hypothetical protein